MAERVKHELPRVPVGSTQYIPCSWDDDFPGITRRGSLLAHRTDMRMPTTRQMNVQTGDMTLVLP